MTPEQRREYDERRESVITSGRETPFGAYAYAWAGMLADRAADLRREVDADSDSPAVLRQVAELLCLVVEHETEGRYP